MIAALRKLVAHIRGRWAQRRAFQRELLRQRGVAFARAELAAVPAAERPAKALKMAQLSDAARVFDVHDEFDEGIEQVLAAYDAVRREELVACIDCYLIDGGTNRSAT